MDTNDTLTNDRPPQGVALPLAAVLVLAALVVGLISGLAVGAAGGYLLGQSDRPPAMQARITDQPRQAVPRPLYGTPVLPPAEDRELPRELFPGATAVTPAPRDTDPLAPAVERPYLGVEVRTSRATPEADDSESTPGPTPEPGAEVLFVQPGTAAAAAGLRAGDIIASIEGRPIADGADLAAAVAQLRVGQEVDIEVRRDGASVTLTATIGARPEVIEVLPGAAGIDDLLEQMPEEMRQYFRDLAPPTPSDPEA